MSYWEEQYHPRDPFGKFALGDASPGGHHGVPGGHHPGPAAAVAAHLDNVNVAYRTVRGEGVTAGTANPLNTSDLEKDWPPRVVHAAKRYQGPHYREINGGLREAKGMVADDHPSRADIAGLDEVHRQSLLPHDVEVFRGLSEPWRVWPNDWSRDKSMVGVEWDDHAYSSTSYDPKVSAGAYSQGDPADAVFMHVRVPKGTGAINFGDTIPVGKAAEGITQSEAELLLQRGLRFRVVADHGVRPSVHGGKRVLEVEVVAAAPI